MAGQAPLTCIGIWTNNTVVSCSVVWLSQTCYGLSYSDGLERNDNVINQKFCNKINSGLKSNYFRFNFVLSQFHINQLIILAVTLVLQLLQVRDTRLGDNRQTPRNSYLQGMSNHYLFIICNTVIQIVSVTSHTVHSDVAKRRYCRLGN